MNKPIEIVHCKQLANLSRDVDRLSSLIEQQILEVSLASKSGHLRKYSSEVVQAFEDRDALEIQLAIIRGSESANPITIKHFAVSKLMMSIAKHIWSKLFKSSG